MKNNRKHKSIWTSFSRLKSCNFAKCVTLSTVVCLSLALVVTLVVTSNPYPAHASCKITWKFTNSCLLIKETIKDQIGKWEGPDNCKDAGQRCLYKLVTESNTSLEATHTTPVNHYVDDLTFNFINSTDGTQCTVKGFSTSEVWYAVLDYGTNYCNLHNLITGAGLDHNSGYSEATKDSQCTQYSKADCDKY